MKVQSAEFTKLLENISLKVNREVTGLEKYEIYISDTKSYLNNLNFLIDRIDKKLSLRYTKIAQLK